MHARRRSKRVRRRSDRSGQRVIAGCFQRCSERHRRRPVGAGGRDDVDHRGPVAGERAGLVERDHAHGAERFERSTALDHQTGLRGGPDRSEHGDRHRDRKCARRCRHQYHERPFDPHRRITQQRPDDRDRGSNDQDPRHQRTSDPIGEPLRPALAVLCFLDRSHHTRQRAVSRRRRRLDLQHTATIDAARQHHNARLDIDRHRLAGHRGHVDTRAALHHDTVGRQPFTRPQHDPVAHPQLGRRDLDRRGVTANPCRVRHQRQHRPQTATRTADGPLLQRFGDREQERQRRRFAELAEHHRTHERNRHQQPDTQPSTAQTTHGAGHERRPASHDRQHERSRRGGLGVGELEDDPD